VAFRTYNLPKLGLEKLAAHFWRSATSRRASTCSRPRSSTPSTSSIKTRMRPRCSSAS
jgi:hypothetical protein